jgi:hypothetical protein
MHIKQLSLALLLGFFATTALSAQGKYLNPAAQREMDKPIITASSILPPGSSSNYSPDNLMDGTVASWSEGVKGSGIGEYLQVDFRFPDEMKYVMIKNGFGKEKYWKANARIREMKITNEEGDTRVIVLEDTPDLQIAGLNYLEEGEDRVLVSTGGLYGSSFKFEITDVYPGEKWQDACIAEMNFNLWHTEMFPMTDEYILKNLFAVFFEGVFDETGIAFVESDWDGYVELDVADEYIYEEIRSGDGTTGDEVYRAYIDHTKNEYYLLSSTYTKDLDFEHMDFNEEEQGDPVWSESFSWNFMKYESFEDKFLSMENSDFSELFDVDPTAALSESSGEKVSYENIWITIDPRGFMNFIYPQSKYDIKAEAFYIWDGSLFIQQGKLEYK